MKKNILRVVLIMLLIVQMWIIFGFSNQNGEESGTISKKITQMITKNIKAIQKLDTEEKERVLKKIEHFIRKLAHFSLYTIIGILSMSLMLTYKIKTKKQMAISGIIGLLYAISDEIHQGFIPNRTPMVGDVAIDSSGVITGILIVFILNRIVKERGVRQKNNKGVR